jgi:glycosyltransferase involved in cell wall biosynthesis
MTYRKAVVVSDLPGMTEIVRNGVNGYTFPSADVSGLSETIIRALSDDAERSSIAANGLEYIRRYHDWYRIGEATANIYRALLVS